MKLPTFIIEDSPNEILSVASLLASKEVTIEMLRDSSIIHIEIIVLFFPNGGGIETQLQQDRLWIPFYKPDDHL